MKLNRKDVTRGLVALGVAGALAGGVGIAQAATGTTGASPVSSTASASPTHMCGGGMHDTAVGEHAPMDAAAKYLGLSRTDLQSQMHAGKSLADIAKAQGKSVSGLKDAMVTAVKSDLDDNTTLTADQRKTLLAQAKSHIDMMVNTTHASGAGHGPMGMRMGGM
ncbi:hypothetical protein OHA74_14110 [Streptomyces phaeochromogenes]|uniref:hypothetical protein n=1 Tax=Streptomyces phaeochromogenes TaxID=1923 RepID=UPI002E2C14DC|nr:hypothetical protein [Streptomyces phaeochromogenes]